MILKIDACMYLYFHNILQNVISKTLIAVTICYWQCNILLINLHLIKFETHHIDIKSFSRKTLASTK